MNYCSFVVGGVSLGLTLLAPFQSRGESLVKNGENVVFLGDSITQGGARLPAGYVNLVKHGLKTNGIEIFAVGAGISGNKSNDMLARVDGLLAKKPNWLFLSCGVNDVMHGDRGIVLEEYKKNIRALVEKAEAAGVKVLILTPTMIGEKEEAPANVKLEGYIAYLHELAAEKKIPVADLNREMREAIKNPELPKGKGDYLTTDGVHMNPLGDEMMAIGVLKGLGFSAEELKKARDAWQEIPSALEVQVKPRITLKQYKQIHEAAVKEGTNVTNLLQKEALERINQQYPPTTSAP